LRDLESSTETFVFAVPDGDRLFQCRRCGPHIAELEKLRNEDPLLVWLSSEPEIDSLRADERLIDLERRVKNAHSQNPPTDARRRFFPNARAALFDFSYIRLSSLIFR
jgi:hypothetical protein